MNVAIFTDNDFSKVNGVTTTLRAMLEHLPPEIHARVYTCEGSSTNTLQYLALRSIGVGIPFYREMKLYLPPLSRLLRHARADGIELVHLTTPGPVGLAALYVASRLGIPMIGSFHTDLTAYARLLSGSTRLARLVQEYMRWPYGKCLRILAPSEATRETLIQAKIDPGKIAIWRRGVSIERFNPEKRSAELRRQWGAAEGTLVLLYVGRVSKEKGLDLLPPLSERLRRSRIAHRLVIVGDGPMRSELMERCEGAVFTGTLSHHDVAVAMASSDLFVFPSRTDTAGNVVLEAQASGLPVLVTDAGGPCENMTDLVTGFVCPDLRAFARRAGELAWNPERHARMRQAARLYALERQWTTALEPVFRAYREAADGRRHPRPVANRPAVASRPA